jgi:predicted nucleic acid-binding protein
MAPVIVDAGLIFAFLDRNEKNHDWVCNQFRKIRGPMFTCDAVLSEVCYLLNRERLPISGLREILRREVILPIFGPLRGHDRALELMNTYAKIPMSFADACLVVTMENYPGSAVFTLDRDFKIYRQHRRRIIPLIAPF